MKTQMKIKLAILSTFLVISVATFAALVAIPFVYMIDNTGMALIGALVGLTVWCVILFLNQIKLLSI